MLTIRTTVCPATRSVFLYSPSAFAGLTKRAALQAKGAGVPAPTAEHETAQVVSRGRLLSALRHSHLAPSTYIKTRCDSVETHPRLLFLFLICFALTVLYCQLLYEVSCCQPESCDIVASSCTRHSAPENAANGAGVDPCDMCSIFLLSQFTRVETYTLWRRRASRPDYQQTSRPKNIVACCSSSRAAKLLNSSTATDVLGGAGNTGFE